MKYHRANSTSLQPVQRSLKAEFHRVRELQPLNAAAGSSHGEKSEGKQKTLQGMYCCCCCLCCRDPQGKGKRSCFRRSVTPTSTLPHSCGLKKHSSRPCLTAAAFCRCKESCNFRDRTSDPVDRSLIGLCN